MNFEGYKDDITTCGNYDRSEMYRQRDLCGCQSIDVGSHAYCQSLWKHPYLILKGKSSVCTLCVCRILVAPVTLASHLATAFSPKLHQQE